MTASSKQNVDLLVRIGVLEKLVDRLMDKIDKLEANVRQFESGFAVQPPPSNPEKDEWEINNLNGTVEKTEDDLEQMMDASI